MLDYLKSRGCRIGGVTLGEKGLIWYDETGVVRSLPALAVPRERVIDTNGAGDVFHGAYILFLSDQSEQKLGMTISYSRAPRLLKDPASRQRGRPAELGADCGGHD